MLDMSIFTSFGVDSFICFRITEFGWIFLVGCKHFRVNIFSVLELETPYGNMLIIGQMSGKFSGFDGQQTTDFGCQNRRKIYYTRKIVIKKKTVWISILI